MRRALMLVLVIAMLLTLCACGNTRKVEEELIGVYYASDQNFTRVISFAEDGTFHEVYENVLGMEDESYGIWKVEKDRIVLYEGDIITYFAYDYNKKSGILTLYLYYIDDDYVSDTPYVKYED